MKFTFDKVVVFFMLAFLSTNQVVAQDNEEESEKQTKVDTLKKGFHLGAYVGSYFANKYTASLYDGYGYDINGQRNNFANSILRYEIVNVYGGGNGGADRIAELLNVAHTDWDFNESGMPINLKYTPAYLIGLNMRYVVDKKQAILFNINGTDLTVNGKFNIYSKSSGTSTNPNTTGQITQNQFTIVGGEQRLLFQFGYQRYYGKNPKINVFTDIGMNIVMAKFKKNQAYITNNNGSIVIDLMSVYNQPNFNYYRAKYFVGVGIGAFASLGINFNINPKYTVQLLYNPSYDLVPLGDTRKFKAQQGIGLRFYYNLSI